MSRPRHVYTIDQLLSLQQSPLIRKPEDLPSIDQWIEITADQNQRRPRAQVGDQNGKGDENEPSGKRPTLFEGRQRHGLSQSGDDVFLGPKMSFASASAARQINRRGGLEEKGATSTIDEPRDKFDRFAGLKDRPRREGFNDREGTDRDKEHDGYRPRFGRQNGVQDEEDYRGKRAGDHHDRGKEARDGGVSLDGQMSRRNAPLRGKFDQPWHRGGNKLENKDERNPEDAPSEGRGWRDQDRRIDRWTSRDNRQEQDPQWMAEPNLGESGDPTQEDFQKWKEKMKAGSDPKPQNIGTPSVEMPPTQSVNPGDSGRTNAPIDESYFGIWGEQKRDTPAPEGQPPTPKATVKPKASRFATMFKDTQMATTPAVAEPQPAAAPPPEEAPKANAASKNTAEDQQGFERMMQMLRMGGGSSQGPQPQLFGRPLSGQYGVDQGRISDTPQMQENNSYNNEPVPRSHFASPNPPPNPQLGPRPVEGAARPPRPELPGRDSSFLLKLMQQPSAFAEGQIYGQSYDRKDGEDNKSSMAHYPPSHQDSRSRAPPPGLYSNEGSFAANQNLDTQFRNDGPMRHPPPPVQINERFGGPISRHNPGEEANLHQGPMFDQFAPSNNGRSNQQQADIPPPPGFSSSRGQAPPGFFPFAGGNPPGPQQQQQQPPQQQYGNGPPPNVRGPMQQPPFQQPPGFYNNAPGGGGPSQSLPPGFMPPIPNQQPNRGPQMRPGGPQGGPQAGLQGPEAYGDAARRGPPPPMQSQWPPQFLKQQMPGGYQGM